MSDWRFSYGSLQSSSLFILLFSAVTSTRPPARAHAPLPLPHWPPRAFPRRPRAAPRSTWRPRRPVRRRGLRGRGGAGPVHVPCPPALGSETPPGPRWAARRALCGGEGELGSRCAPCALDGDSECRFHSRRARPSRGSGGSLAPIPESSGRRECLGCSWGAWALLSCVQLV